MTAVVGSADPAAPPTTGAAPVEGASHDGATVDARRSARAVGVFFLLATAAGLAHMALAAPVLGGDDLLADVAAGRTRLLVGVLAVLVMAVSVVGVSVAAYPVLRRRSPGLALGYVASRTAEGIFFAVGAVLLVGVVVVADNAAGSGGTAGARDLDLLGEVLVGMREWGAGAVLNTAVFPVGALIFYGLLHRARLVPRWLAAWGFVGALIYLAAGLLLALDQVAGVSTETVLLNMPLAVNELVLAVWLIVRGFDPAGLAALPDRSDR